MSGPWPSETSERKRSPEEPLMERAGPSAREGSGPGADTLLGGIAASLGGGVLARKVQRRALQRRAAGPEEDPAALRAAAERGIGGVGGPLPHLQRIQESFGGHDVRGVTAHADAGAQAAAREMGADAYAAGDHVAFAGTPSLHTAAHEAAHVVQQQAGVQLSGGVGQEGDAHERYADAVADRVVQGRSAADLLDAYAGAATGAGARGAQRMPAAGVQLHRTSRLHGTARLSENGNIVSDGPKKLYATPDLITKAAQELAAVGALVTLKASSDNTTYSFEGKDLVKVELALNETAVKGQLWQRLKNKQPGQGGYRSYADCFRTSATVSGINPGVGGQKEELHLPTGTVKVMGKLEAVERGVTDTPAARAEASFFDHAIPKFVEVLEARHDKATYTELIVLLKGYQAGKSKIDAGILRYKKVLATEGANKLFASTFGINEALAPAVGTALTQVNDPAEKATAEEQGQEKWNFHWAGVILRDGADYTTLENCAVEISDATAQQITDNADIVNEGTNPQTRTMKSQRYTKQDLINDRWYFKLYGPEKQSFHAENLADPHATPSAITLPVSKG